MQDNINTLNKELVDAKISLDEIYLDPNNPRACLKNKNCTKRMFHFPFS